MLPFQEGTLSQDFHKCNSNQQFWREIKLGCAISSLKCVLGTKFLGILPTLIFLSFFSISSQSSFFSFKLLLSWLFNVFKPQEIKGTL